MLHVVLYEPEIPQNTGNIIRTCMATGSRLHLIEPLGFSLDEKHLRRSGMDYIKDADIHIHKNWDAFVDENPSEHYYFMTRYGKKAPSEFDFTKEEGDVYLVLGKESTGVDKKNSSTSFRYMYAFAYGRKCEKFEFVQLCCHYRL